MELIPPLSTTLLYYKHGVGPFKVLLFMTLPEGEGS
jgi:hypothetical protein